MQRTRSSPKNSVSKFYVHSFPLAQEKVLFSSISIFCPFGLLNYCREEEERNGKSDLRMFIVKCVPFGRKKANKEKRNKVK